MHCDHGGDLPSTETKAQSRQASEQKVGWAQQRMNWCFPRAAAIISSCRLYAWHRTRRKHLAWREFKQTAVRGQKVKGTKPLERLPHNFSSWWTLQDLDTLSDSNISTPPHTHQMRRSREFRLVWNVNRSGKPKPRRWEKVKDHKSDRASLLAQLNKRHIQRKQGPGV